MNVWKKKLPESSLAPQMDALWDEAKEKEKKSGQRSLATDL